VGHIKATSQDSYHMKSLSRKEILEILDHHPGYGSHVQMQNSDLREVDLSCIQFRYVDLQGSDLSGANLQGTELENSCLVDIQLVHAKFMHMMLISWSVRANSLAPSSHWMVA
jgi:uncharacterized protein YjbI with pentapeptide repeats